MREAAAIIIPIVIELVVLTLFLGMVAVWALVLA
jgi:hypothetical protein